MEDSAVTRLVGLTRWDWGWNRGVRVLEHECVAQEREGSQRTGHLTEGKARMYVLGCEGAGVHTKEYTYNGLQVRENKAPRKACKSQAEANSMKQARWCKERRGAGGETGRLSMNTSGTPGLFVTPL